MKKLITLLIASLISLSAFAHGPTPQKVEKSVVIKADPAKVWALIKDFGSIQKWHPAIKDCKLEKQGEDSFRTITFKNGSNAVEKLRTIDETAMKMKYEIVSTSLPIADYNATISLTPSTNGKEVTVTWLARFYRVYKLNPPIPPGQDDESAIKAVATIVEEGLSNLAKISEAQN